MTESGFGDLLRRYRVAAGLTQEELAERSGLSTRGISDLERGARGLPRKDTLELLLNALDLSEADRAALVASARRPPAPPQQERTDAPPTLPVPLTPLIGREAEITAVTAFLNNPTVRLLTLTGPGGTGKTRLALAVAGQVAAVFPDGMVFVALAPLGDPAFVGSAIAHQLGVREAAGQSLLDQLKTHLYDKHLLLVLDNFEHLLPAVPLVAEMLSACPSLTVLTTSRAALHLSGEHTYPVLPLELPHPDRLPSLDELVRTAAVRLFVDRAHAAKPEFALTEANAPAVVEIVRRLDGLPLALELAAARVRVFSPAALLARLDQRLPLLTGGAQDLPARQRTLRATIAWSYDLLTPEEQTLFRRLEVFAGGWTFDAAEAVASRGEEPDGLEAMTSLLDKNLVRQADQAADEPRFTMLETIREFALAQLHEHPPDEGSSWLAHTAFFADLALTARAGINVGVPETIRGLRAEEDNVRTMLTQLLATGDAETALCVVGGSLVDYWTVAGGQFGEARTWLDRAFKEATASPKAQAWGYNGLTVVAIFQGDYQLARMAATECRVLAQAIGDPELAARGALAMCVVEEAEGRVEAINPLAIEAIEAARAADDSGTLGWALQWLGTAQWHAGLLQEAISTLEEALALFRDLGGVWGESFTLLKLADVARAAGSLERAARLHADSLLVRRGAGVLSDAFVDLVGIAQIAQAKGHLEPAARLLGAEDTYRTDFGSAGWGVTPVRREQTRQAVVEQLGDEQFRQLWDAGQALSIEEAIDEALVLADGLAPNQF